jgi:hypothetical protein
MPYATLSNNTIACHGSAAEMWPHTSFSTLGPNASFLAEVGAVLIRSNPPYDPTTEILQSCAPYLLDGAVFDTIAAPIPPPPPPAPDWARFKSVALTSESLRDFMANAYQVNPFAAGLLVPALLSGGAGDASDFARAWSAIGQAVVVPSEVVAAFLAVAADCNLPEEFVAVLQPPNP